MKNFLVLGGESKLAKIFYLQYKRESVALNKKECDITNYAAVESVIKKYPAKFVLNCAAITDVDYCEQNPKLCFEVNTAGVFILRKVCDKYKRKLLHISSDYAVKPVNAYGYSKLFSEQILAGRHLVFRTNFYHSGTFIVKELLSGNSINAYTNIFFNPISVNGLVAEIYKMKNKTGLRNIFTKEKISYFAFAEKFCEAFGLNISKLARPSKRGLELNGTPRPLTSYVKSDIDLRIGDDLKNFKKFLEYSKNLTILK